MPKLIKNVYCKKETDRAILVVLEDRDEPIWIPQSQIHEDSEVYGEGHEGALIISDWLAEKIDLELDESIDVFF